VTDLPTGRREEWRQPVFKFTHTSKISIFAPQGRLVAAIHVKLGTAEGHVSSLGRAKFHANRCPEVGTRPQKWQKFALFGKETPAGTNPLTDFYNC